jgi:hypothetical protein
VLEPEVIHHQRQDEHDDDLDQDVQTNPNAMDLLRLGGG